MIRRIATLVTSLSLIASAAVADEGATPTEEGETYSLVNPEKSWVVTGQLDINLSKDLAGKPISIAPDIWYGLTHAVTLGLVHTSQSTDGFWGGAGSGLCFQDEEDGCIRGPYNNVGLLARVALDTKKLALAFDGGLVFRDFDPFAMAAKLGVTGAKQLGPVLVVFAPNLYIGFTERDAGNKELLNVPVSVLYAATPKVSVGVQTGFSTPLEDAGDLWRIPVSLVGQALLSDKYYAFFAFSLPSLAGGDLLQTGFDARAITIGGGAAF